MDLGGSWASSGKGLGRSWASSGFWVDLGRDLGGFWTDLGGSGEEYGRILGLLNKYWADFRNAWHYLALLRQSL